MTSQRDTRRTATSFGTTGAALHPRPRSQPISGQATSIPTSVRSSYDNVSPAQITKGALFGIACVPVTLTLWQIGLWMAGAR